MSSSIIFSMPALSVFFVLSFLYLKLRHKKEQLTLHYHPQSALINKVLNTTQLKQLTFSPSLLLFNGNLQCIINPFKGNYLKRFMPFRYSRELFVLKDGGTIGLDWLEGIPFEKQGKSIVAIVPGLSSDSNEVYVVNLVLEAQRNGFKPVVINYRGASNVGLTTGKLYCAGSTDDVREPLRYIYEKYCQNESGRDRPLYLVGNSMGANLTANFLGKEGGKSFIRAAVCVQPPLKMWECGKNLEHRNMGFYNYVLGNNLKRKINLFAPKIHQHYKDNHGIDVHQVLSQCRHLIDIDTHMTAKSFGYGNIENYYDKASCIHRIPHIKTPLFIMMARDDPIIGENAIDHETCKENPYILLGVTDQGGHIGYFESMFHTRQWHTQPVFEFLKSFQ
ncbi:hypothetical protein FGO68_gene4857 [Halteria grandinella]|uniref:Serine aminopeptidase S33 domain-containing protein n=1 Tax=Halteria grandinella TaxID=5974 RepID=A0A8J8NLT8_HALGN|nr:hypothetical protein FGO68_gene4857 [Halteria grandinella]